MMISSRGTYALRVLCDLAAHRDGSYVALKDENAISTIGLEASAFLLAATLLTATLLAMTDGSRDISRTV